MSLFAMRASWLNLGPRIGQSRAVPSRRSRGDAFN
jgi:hypothetical protein